MSKYEKIVIASDHAGLELKAKIIDHLKNIKIVVEDFGTYNTESVDYPIYGKKIGEIVSENKNSYLGIVVCGSGIGISIAANKVPEIRCALIYSKEVAFLAKQHNNANVIAFGARTMNHEMVIEAIDAFLTSEFLGNQHARRIAML